jgi:hypothetical protein
MPEQPHTYLAIFEIDDLGAPMLELIRYAEPEVAVMAAGDGARIVGDLTWTVAGDRLVCEAPAIPVPLDMPEIDVIAVERACRGDAVPLSRRELLAAVARLERQGLSAKEISRRLHRSSRTVQRCRQLQRVGVA